MKLNRFRKKKIAVLFLTSTLACAVIFTSGCSNLSSIHPGNGIYTPNPTSAALSPVKGGILSLYMTKPDTLDPMVSTNVYVQRYSGFIYESLFEVDAKMKATPVLISEYSVSEDGLTWTFKLKENVKWHNNEILSTADVGYTVNLLKNGPQTLIYKNNVSNIKEFAAINVQSFTLKLTKPDSFLLSLLTFPIMQKDYKQNDTAPIGTGRFKFVGRDDQAITLNVNDDWRDAGDPAGETYFFGILLRIFDGLKLSENDAILQKKVDAGIINNGDYARFMKAFGFGHLTYLSDRFEFLAFNISRPKLENKLVRQAIACAIDQNDLANRAFGTKAVISDLPLPPDSDYNFGNDLSIQYDIEKARSLLSKSGLIEENKMFTILNAQKNTYEPFSIEILIDDGNPMRLEAARYIDGQLKKAGISSYISSVPYATYISLLISGNYEVAISGIKTVPYVPGNLGIYSSASLPGINSAAGYGAGNIARYKNADVDNILNNIHNIYDSTELKTEFWKLKKILNDELPYLGLYYQLDAIAFRQAVQGVETPGVMTPAWEQYENIADWYFGGDD